MINIAHSCCSRTVGILKRHAQKRMLGDVTFNKCRAYAYGKSWGSNLYPTLYDGNLVSSKGFRQKDFHRLGCNYSTDGMYRYDRAKLSSISREREATKYGNIINRFSGPTWFSIDVLEHCNRRCSPMYAACAPIFRHSVLAYSG